ncbi:SprT-like domain-containing protein [Motilibacter rhizosphaerae]|nr:SprT-like domain-containing protein [Motilibacter rhizosphaerae]
MDLDDARRLAQALLAEHGLHDWTFRYDRARTRAGLCDARARVVSLSRALTELHDEAEVRETLLHEVAHALVGPGHGHDAVWRATARRIGASGERCVPATAARVEGEWVGTCPAGHTTSAHRSPVRVRSCRRCSDRFSLDAVFAWTRAGEPADLHPRYRAELARLRAAAAAAGGQGPDAVPAPRTPAAPLLEVGARVLVVAPGPYRGTRGTVLKRGRTRYHLRTASGVLTAPFAAVAPLPAAPRSPVRGRRHPSVAARHPRV